MRVANATEQTFYICSSCLCTDCGPRHVRCRVRNFVITVRQCAIGAFTVYHAFEEVVLTDDDAFARGLGQ